MAVVMDLFNSYNFSDAYIQCGLKEIFSFY